MYTGFLQSSSTIRRPNVLLLYSTDSTRRRAKEPGGTVEILVCEIPSITFGYLDRTAATAPIQVSIK